MEATCQNCKQKLFVEPPAMAVDNRPEYSMIIFIHQHTETCPHCGRELSAMIINLEQAKIEMAYFPIKRESPIVKPTASEAKVLVRPNRAN